MIEPGYVLTYYPGTTDASTAVPIEILPGSELSTIDFTLTRQQLFRIHGRVMDARTGQPPRNANVSLDSRDQTLGFTTFSGARNYNPANGTFELRDVAAGSYWVRAAVLSEPGMGLTGANVSRNMAQAAVDVSNADIEDLVVVLTPGFSIAGRIHLDGAPLSTLPNIERTRILLAPIEQIPISTMPQLIKVDGTFVLDNVQPGDYRINLIPTPPNTYIKSVLLGRNDVSSGVSITGPSADSLEVVLGRDGGQIDGTILDNDQKPLAGVQAVLIPNDRSRRDRYRLGVSDQNGKFTMRTIAPGDYKLFAWEDFEPGAHNDPDFVRRYEALAPAVRVTESATFTLEVKVLPPN
jgi:hypothetical protein